MTHAPSGAAGGELRGTAEPGEHVTALPGPVVIPATEGGPACYGVVGTVMLPAMIFALKSSIFALYGAIFGFDVA
jgi:hypothetical protein